ncbi:Alpha-acetolactate decarboxylase [Lactococcus lactis subsp. lactis Dephy 1]|uniref:acetolactate decarboxylase n=1 Tax=Lactococcus lactis TaxID=1358 RepID=UPI0003B83C87|nr:acetolactate decarboxylase [Lactococcus lactis]CDI46601.1 Alpha-acetolactate decarboxylase [Lactococcus lactis subsp. lactis Dephy 1]
MTEITKLFQYNTLGALMAGLYEGTMTIGELLKHGDLGIGTLDSVDGELIVLDGKAYQAKGDKTIVELTDDIKVPYAAVVPHQAEVVFKQKFTASDKELENRIESYFDGQNLFRSIKITGEFPKMHVRMIPRAKSGTRFVEVSQNQPEYTEENVKGTIVGIWTPEMFHGVSVAGYHLHFISEDFTFGGHVLDFIIDNGTVEIGAIDQLNQSFPVQDRKFLFADLDIEALKKDIDVAE